VLLLSHIFFHITRDDEYLSRANRCHAQRVISKQLCRTSQSARLWRAKIKRKKKKRPTGGSGVARATFLSYLSLSLSLSFSLPLLFSFSSSQGATAAARRLGSMRAQMGLCLMKFGPSCTCHFRGISDQRPLHRLEHPSRNWRESRSQEPARLIRQRLLRVFSLLETCH